MAGLRARPPARPGACAKVWADVVCHTDDVAAVTRAHAPPSAPALSPCVAPSVGGASFSLAVIGGPLTSAGASSSPQMSTPRRPRRSLVAATGTEDVQRAGHDVLHRRRRGRPRPRLLRAEAGERRPACALDRRFGLLRAAERERNLNDALVEEASGARSTEAQTHLPLSVTTFNTIESVSLLTLCPSEQKLLPASVRTKSAASARRSPSSRLTRLRIGRRRAPAAMSVGQSRLGNRAFVLQTLANSARRNVRDQPCASCVRGSFTQI